MSRAECVCGLVAVGGLAAVIAFAWWPGVLVFVLGGYGLLGKEATV